MNSREQKGPGDELDGLIRRGLRASLASKRPSAELRRRLLQRAAEQQRRSRLWLPVSVYVWAAEPRVSFWSDLGWRNLNHINLLRTWGFMGFPNQIQ
ncbi:MAG: hypothetical protein ACRDH2_06520 [Anaerolineales bacterium]